MAQVYPALSAGPSKCSVDPEGERAEGLTVPAGPGDQCAVFWMTRPEPRCRDRGSYFLWWHLACWPVPLTFVLAAVLLSLEGLGSSWLPSHPALLSPSPESGWWEKRSLLVKEGLSSSQASRSQIHPVSGPQHRGCLLRHGDVARTLTSNRHARKRRLDFHHHAHPACASDEPAVCWETDMLTNPGTGASLVLTAFSMTAE